MIKILRKIINKIKNLTNKLRFKSFGSNSLVLSPTCLICNKRNIVIGKNTLIGKFARIEPVINYSGIKYDPLIEIGSNVCINQNFHCTCAKSIKIGNGTSITANCGVFDIIHPYEDVSINPRFAKIDIEPVIIGENCLIGMNSVILPGTQLGNHCVIGANSVLKGIYPDYCVIVGSPAYIVKRYNPQTSCWEKTNPDGSFI